MTLRDLKIFVSVYKSRSMTKAAEDLFLTQPDVSRVIRCIEKEYGIALFERFPNIITPTDAGERFYSYALSIVETINELDAEFDSGEVSGLVRVGATDILGCYLPSMIRDFMKLFPNSRIKAEVLSLPDLVVRLVNNDLDFALVEGPVDDMGGKLIVEPFRTDELILVVPRDFSVPEDTRMTLGEIIRHPLILREPGSIDRILVDSVFRSHGLEPVPVFESNSVHAILQAVYAGIGVTILPREPVMYIIEGGYLGTRGISDASFTRSNSIVMHKKKRLSPGCSAFFNLCREKAGRGMGEGGFISFGTSGA